MTTKAYHNKKFGLASVTALAVGATLAFAPMKAEAAMMYASSAVEVGNASNVRGTANDRDNINNAVDGNFNTFFELGYGGVVDFQFGKKFVGPGSVFEITNGNSLSWPEAVEIRVGIDGVFSLVDPIIFTNSDTTFTFSGGPFDTLRLTDVTQDKYPNGAASDGPTGGFDVAAVGVNPAPVPLPASALLLLGGIGGLGGASALRRRRKTA